MVAGGESVGHLSRTHRLASVPGGAFREMEALARVPFKHDVPRVGSLGQAARQSSNTPFCAAHTTISCFEETPSFT